MGFGPLVLADSKPPDGSRTQLLEEVSLWLQIKDQQAGSGMYGLGCGVRAGRIEFLLVYARQHSRLTPFAFGWKSAFQLCR